MPLTAGSTLGEWLADPNGAQVLGAAFASLTGDRDSPMATFLADPAMLLFLSSIPLARLTAFPGTPLTPDTVAKLIAAAND